MGVSGVLVKDNCWDWGSAIQGVCHDNEGDIVMSSQDLAERMLTAGVRDSLGDRIGCSGVRRTPMVSSLPEKCS